MTKELAEYMRTLANGGHLKLAAWQKRAEAEIESENPAVGADAGTQDAEPGAFFEEQEDRQDEDNESPPGEEPEVGEAKDTEEVGEGLELQYAGGEPPEEPSAPPTEDATTPEEMDEIKNATLDELANAANDLLFRLALQLDELAAGGVKAAAELAPEFFAKAAMDEAALAAERQADLTSAILQEMAKMAQEAEETKSEEKSEEGAGEGEGGDKGEGELGESEVDQVADIIADSVNAVLRESGIDPDSLSEEELAALTEAVMDELGAEPGAEPPKEEEGGEAPEPDEGSEAPTEDEESAMAQQILSTLGGVPAAEAIAPEKVASMILNASDEELLDAIINACYSTVTPLEKVAQSGELGKVLAKCAEAHYQSKKYKPLKDLPAEKRARAQQLRNYMESFLSELVKVNKR